MEIEHPELIDFLDKPNEAREAGLYTYYDEQFTHLKDIPEDYFGYVIRKKALGGNPGLVQIYRIEMQLNEVFSTAQATPPTYVSRKFDKTTTYESTLDLLIREPGGIAVIYGPSKLGKTALWRLVIDKSNRITISCSNATRITDVYKQILFEVNPAFISELTDLESDKRSTDSSGEIALGKKDVIQAAFRCGSANQKEKTQHTLYKFPSWLNNVDTVVRALSGKNKNIIFENYHRLNANTLRQLCVDLRTYSDNKINVLLVGIPDNPYEIMNYNQELEGRVFFLRFTFWNDADLRKIALGGQEPLSADFTNKTLEFITKEAAGSPFLMQLNCFIACLASNVLERLETRGTVDISEEDYKLIMTKWGGQRIGGCKPICDRLSAAILKIPDLGKPFLESVFNAIKTSPAKLVIEIEPPFWPRRRNKIKMLLRRLNQHELTRDLITLNEKEGKLNINIPNFISYIRWIHEREHNQIK